MMQVCGLVGIVGAIALVTLDVVIAYLNHEPDGAMPLPVMVYIVPVCAYLCFHTCLYATFGLIAGVIFGWFITQLMPGIKTHE